MSNVRDLNTSATYQLRLVLGGTLLLLVFLGLSVTGCNGGGLAVSGHVTVDGQPLDDGDIVFSPTTPGTAAVQTDVIDGEYHFPASAGLTSGAYQVAVTALRKSGKKIPIEEGSTEMIESLEQYIPPKYNVESTLTIEIPAEQVDRDFDLILDGR